MRPKWNPRDLPNLQLWMNPKRQITKPYPTWLRKVRAKLGGWSGGTETGEEQ